jgi:hypothetical protein
MHEFLVTSTNFCFEFCVGNSYEFSSYFFMHEGYTLLKQLSVRFYTILYIVGIQFYTLFVHNSIYC